MKRLTQAAPLLWSVALLASAPLARAEAPARATTSYSFVAQWGSYGSGPGQLRWPEHLSFDNEGNLWVADHGNDRIQKFSSEGRFLFKFGIKGSAPGRTDRPIGVAVAPNGHVYVSESYPNQRVQEFTPSGAYVNGWGHWGSCHGEFMYAGCVGVAPNGDVFVADVGNYRVQRFSSDGTFVTTWGSFPGCNPGDWEGGLSLGGVFVSRSGTVFVGNGSALEEYTPDGILVRRLETGVPVAGIAEDPNDGTLYVAGGSSHRVQALAADGTPLGSFGEAGSGPGQFNYAVGIAVDASGFIYVSDLYNYRIQKFARDAATPVMRSTWGRLKTLYR